MSIQFRNAGIWLLRLLAAIILLQTLFFKFTAAEESVYIFTKLGMEPYGRIGIGILELVASILILYPKTTLYGAILALGLMTGSIIFSLHKTGHSSAGRWRTIIYLCFAGICCICYTHIRLQAPVIPSFKDQTAVNSNKIIYYEQGNVTSQKSGYQRI